MFLLTTLGYGLCMTILAVAWVLDRPGLLDVHNVKGGWNEAALTAANAPGQGRDELTGIPISAYRARR